MASLLVPLVKDPDDDVRKVVAETLGRIGSLESKALLSEMLMDPSPNVSLAAARALGNPEEMVC